MTAPDSGETEVTVLGRGVGESIAVHLLDGEWMIVDTYRTSRRETAAGRYLESIGVERGQVSTVVVTHWHTDHYSGTDLLLDQYPDARLVVSSAIGGRRFVELMTDPAAGELRRLGEAMLRAKHRRLSVGGAGLRYVSMGSVAPGPQGTTVRFLSPTHSAVSRTNDELGMALASESRDVVRSQLRDDNRCSIALLIELLDGGSVLLGGDLIADHPDYGWPAVVEEKDHRQLPRASLVKVPHHGSANADDPVMWEALTRQPHLFLAPYWRSKIPTADQIQVFLARGRSLYQAAPSIKPPAERPVVDEWGNRVENVPTGRITARKRTGEADWRIEVAGVAFEIEPPA